MTDYTLRNVKGSELTYTEVDNNFIASRSTARLNSCSIILPATGLYVNQSFGGVPMGTDTLAADTIQLSPFYTGYELEIDQVGVWQTSGGSQDLRILIYSSDTNGRPYSKLAETATITTAANDNTVALSFTFTANTLYWVGNHSGGTETFRSIEDDNLLPLGVGTGLNTTAQLNHIALGSTAIGAAPSTWSFAVGQLASAASLTSIGFRAV